MVEEENALQNDAVIDYGEQADLFSDDFEDDEEFEMLVSAFMRDMDYTTKPQAVMNVVYSIINAGIITLPFTAYKSGILVFTAVLVLMALISGYVSVMIICMANEQRVRTLEDLADLAFGPKGYFMVSILQMLFSFTLMCVSLSVWADILEDVFTDHEKFYLLGLRRGQVLIGAVLILPVTLLKKSMSSQKWTSHLTVLAVVASLATVVSLFFTEASESDDDNLKTDPLEVAIHLSEPASEWWVVAFSAIMCYSYNQKVLVCYNCLRRRTADRWKSVMQYAGVSVTLVYVTFGILGYLSMKSKGDKVMNLNFFMLSDGESSFFDGTRIVFAASLLLTIPVDCLVATTTWRRMWHRYHRLNSTEADRREHLWCRVFSNLFQQNKTPFTSGSSEGFHDFAPSRTLTNTSSNTSSNLTDTNTEFNGGVKRPKQDDPEAVLPREPSHPRGTTSPPPGFIERSGRTDERKREYMERRERHRASILSTRTAAIRSSRDRNSYNSNDSRNDMNGGSLRNLLRGLLGSARKQRGNEGFFSRTSEDVGGTNEVRDDESSCFLPIGEKGNPQCPSNDSYDSTNELNKSDTMVKTSSPSGWNVIATLEETVQPPEKVPPSPLQTPSPSGQMKKSGGSVGVLDQLLQGEAFPTIREEDLESSRRSYAKETEKRPSFSSRSAYGGSSAGSSSAKDRASNKSVQEILENANFPAQEEADRMLDTSREISNISVLPSRSELVPAFVLWFCTLALCLVVDQWIYLAVSIGTLSTLALLFVIPSMLYFRLGLTSDFEAQPLIAEIIPNHIYMLLIQILGLLLLTFDLATGIYALATGEKVILKYS